MATGHKSITSPPQHIRGHKKPVPPVCSCQPGMMARWREEQLPMTSARGQRSGETRLEIDTPRRKRREETELSEVWTEGMTGGEKWSGDSTELIRGNEGGFSLLLCYSRALLARADAQIQGYIQPRSCRETSVFKGSLMTEHTLTGRLYCFH